jgi:hypothetical protein
MNALLYLGVPMMAKFSPELNMVRSDAYLASMAEHCSREGFDFSTSIPLDNTIVSYANFSIPYFHGTFALHDKSDKSYKSYKSYKFLLFGLDFYVISLDFAPL